jgi:hypothetical protein
MTTKATTTTTTTTKKKNPHLSVGRALLDPELRHAGLNRLRHPAQRLHLVDDDARLLIELIGQILNRKGAGKRVGDSWDAC